MRRDVDEGVQVVGAQVAVHRILSVVKASIYPGLPRERYSTRKPKFFEFMHQRRDNPVPPNRTVSWLMSIPRLASRSWTLRSDSGGFTYINYDQTDDLWRVVDVPETVLLPLARP
jgi:hypothetical protein